MKCTRRKLAALSSVLVLVGLCDYSPLASGQSSSGQSRHERRASAAVSAWIRIAERQPSLLHRVTAEEDFDVYFETQIELIRSPLVLDQLLADKTDKGVKGLSLLRQQKNPGAWLARELSVVRRGKSELLVVSLKADERQQAAKVVNAVVAAYFKANARDRSIQIRQKIESLKKEKPRRVRRILDLRDELEKLDANNNGKDVQSPDASSSELEEATDQAALVRQIVDMSRSELRAKATDLYMKLKTREAQRQNLLKRKPKSDDPMPTETFDEQIVAHPEIQELERLVDEHFTKMEAFRTASVLGEEDPKYEKVSKSFAKSKLALNMRRDLLRRDLIDQMRENRQEVFEGKVAQMDTDIEGFRLRLGVLTQQYFQQIHKDRSTDRKGLERVLLATELAKEEKLAEAIVERVAQLQAELHAPSRLTLLRGARP